MGYLKVDKGMMASLMYTPGMRPIRCIGLSIQDLDFFYNEILTRGGKVAKERFTMSSIDARLVFVALSMGIRV